MLRLTSVRVTNRSYCIGVVLVSGIQDDAIGKGDPCDSGVKTWSAGKG
jgi:hypothetical protein